MRTFFLSIWKSIFELVIFAGFPFISFLRSDSAKTIFSEAVVKHFYDFEFSYYTLFLFIFISLKFLNHQSRTATMADISEAKEPIREALQNLAIAYNKAINEKKSTGLDFSFRINIMLQTSTFLGFKKHLKIFFYTPFPSVLTYPEHELNMQWNKGQGACGTAWEKGRFAIADAIDKNHNHLNKTLSKEQSKLVEENQSVISIPLRSSFRHNRNVFGVLNFDSNFPLNRTLFNDEEIRDIIETHSHTIAYILSDFYHGVSPE